MKKHTLKHNSRLFLMSLIIASALLVILSSVIVWASWANLFTNKIIFIIIYCVVILAIVILMTIIIGGNDIRLITLANNRSYSFLKTIALSCLGISFLYTFLILFDTRINWSQSFFTKFFSIVSSVVVGWITFIKQVPVLDVKLETQAPKYYDKDLLIIKANTKFKVQALVDGDNSDTVKFVGFCLNDKLTDIMEHNSNDYILPIFPNDNQIIQSEEIEPHKLSRAYDLTGKAIIKALNINAKEDEGRIICFLYENSDSNFFYKNAYLELDDQGKGDMPLESKTTANKDSKKSKGLTWIWGFLISIFIVAVVGLFYSIYYEIIGYNIDFLPDVGTPADFCGVLGTMLAIFVTWQQIKKSDDKVREDNKKARKKLKVSQEQFNKTIDEMQKEREEAYKPDLYMDSKKMNFSISRDSIDVIPILGTKNKKVDIINVGAGTAKNIIIEAYSKDNLNYLSNYTETNFNMVEQDNVILCDLPDVSPVSDKIKPKSGEYLFSKEKLTIDLPEIYLHILRDYIFELDSKEKIDGDPFTKLPKFTYIITYQDQEEITYSKEVIISAKCWNTKPNGMTEECNVTLSVENKSAQKV